MIFVRLAGSTFVCAPFEYRIAPDAWSSTSAVAALLAGAAGATGFSSGRAAQDEGVSGDDAAITGAVAGTIAMPGWAATAAGPPVDPLVAVGPCPPAHALRS